MNQPIQEHLGKDFVEFKIKNQLPVFAGPFCSAFPTQEIGNNIFEELVRDKALFKNFVSYLVDHAEPRDLGMLTLLFKESETTKSNLFHDAVVGDKLLADNFLKLLITSQESCSF